MIKCVLENCCYYDEHRECSSGCLLRGIKKDITNADRIRSLNDEELAEYIFELGNYTEYCYDHCAYSGDNALCRERSNNGRNHDGCLRGVIDWLRQPAKEE